MMKLKLFQKYPVINNQSKVIEKQMILKYKWETMGDDENEANEKNGGEVLGDPSILARRILFEELFTREELEDLEADEEDESNMRDAEMRMTFDLRTGVMDMRKRRATDIKNDR